MKQTICLLLLVVFWFIKNDTVFGQVKTKIFPEEIPSKFIKHQNEANVIKLEAPKNFVEKEKDYVLRKNHERENQFAASLPVNINVLSETNKKPSDNSIFSVTIIAQHALNISVEFSKFELMPGDILSIFTNKELTDSITFNQNNNNNVWATRVYQGNKLTFVVVSNFKKELSKLIIGKINFGYKPFGDYGKIGASALCQINANCPEGDGWDNEKNSVAMIVADGTEQCTGALVMNTCNNDIPYFLTANHCLGVGNVPNWVFQFQTLSTDCATNTGWREDVQFNGCVLRASNNVTDFALLQLNQTPAINSGIFYSGWSRDPFGMTSATVLHHPAGDLMKIARDNDSPIQGSFNSTQCWALDLDLGHLEGGSSGAPYYNQAHRIIAQHYGRPDANSLPICDITVTMGGRFDYSWAGGGTNSTRLSNWLDPIGSNAFATNTTNVSALASYTLSISGGSDLICVNGSSSTYTVNRLPAGATIAWSLSNPYIASLTSNGNQATVTKTGDGFETLIATIGNTTCVANNTISKTIRLGIYSTSEYNITQWPTPACINGNVQVGMPWYYEPPAPGTTYNWYWSSNLAYVSGQGTNVVTLGVTTSNPTPWVMGRANNDCGTGPFQAIELNINPYCSGFSAYKVSPNPTNSSLTVSVKEDNKNLNYSSFDEVRIYDQQGNLKMYRKFNKVTSARMNVGSLFNGMYIVEISSGTYKERQQLVIQK